MPEIATDSSMITRDSLPPYYAQLYTNGTETRIFLNLNNTITSIKNNEFTFTLDGKTVNSVELNSSGTLQLVGDSLTPGNSYYYGTDSGGTKGYYAFPNNNTSNVIFCFGTGGGSHTANTFGLAITDGILGLITDATNVYWVADSTTYRTILTTKFVKIAGVSTVTVWASIWQYGADGDQSANCKVDIGGANGNVSGTGGQKTPEWKSFTVDVSGLTNGTTYDVTIQLKNTHVDVPAYLDSIIGIGS